MFEQIQSVLSKQLRIDPSKIKLESDLKKDLGADSLSLMELVLTLEDDYGITFDQDSLTKIETVSDVVKYMEKHPQ